MKYVDYVVKHDLNGVWPTCECGKELVYKPGGFGRFCSKSCASAGENNAMGRLKGAASPNYGQIRTPEQRANYSKGAHKRWERHGDMLRTMMNTPEYKEAQAEAQRAGNKIDLTRNTRRHKSVNRFWASDSDITKQRRKEASSRAIVLLEQNKLGPRAPFKCEWVDNPFTGQKEYMHSGWETQFLQRCIAEGRAVTKSHGIRISYQQADGTVHQYVPDFKALDADVLFEVKGMLTAADELKLKAAEREGYEVVLVQDLD